MLIRGGFSLVMLGMLVMRRGAADMRWVFFLHVVWPLEASDVGDAGH